MGRKKKIFAIVDIETTGGMSQRDKITEIGVVIYDGERVVKSWETLINPERSIPYNITGITGITNEMVEDAPRFYEVAKDFVEVTEGCVFVAHNVRFDYGFLRKEFENLGYTYTRKQLCTVKLSRKVFPRLKSYSLGNLIKHFNIEVPSRHRALADAEATAIIFDKIVKSQIGQDNIDQLINYGIKETRLPGDITIESLDKLPEASGVYYMHNSYGHVVYVGKSKNIKKRIIQHFQKVTKKNEDMLKMVHSFSFEITGSEFIALLLESKEIKSLSPVLNKAQRTKTYPYFIYTFRDLRGVTNFAIQKSNKKNKEGKLILNYYSSRMSAKSSIKRILKHFELCDHYVGLSDPDGEACFSYQTKKCLGMCKLEESSEDYNERADLAIEYLTNHFQEDFLIITEGRNFEERGLVLVQDKDYRGFGYMHKDDIDLGIEECLEAIDYVEPNPETNMLVRNFLEATQCHIIKI